MLGRGSGHVANAISPAAYAAWPGATGYVAARWAMSPGSGAVSRVALADRARSVEADRDLSVIGVGDLDDVGVTGPVRPN